MTKPVKGPCDGNPMCIKGKENIPLLENIRTGLIDPDTPKSAMTRTSAEGKTQKLVFSDEFNTAGRTFYDGDDPYWQAVDIWYGATQDLEVRNNVTYCWREHLLTLGSGMIQMRRTPKMAHSFSSLTPSRTTVSSIGPEWYSHGTECATRRDISRLVFLCQEKAMSAVSGLASGRWETLLVPVTLVPLKVFGHTATTINATLASPLIRAPTTVLATCQE